MIVSQVHVIVNRVSMNFFKILQIMSNFCVPCDGDSVRPQSDISVTIR